MFNTSYLRLIVVATVLALASVALAADNPILERQKAMKKVGKAAKPMGQMLRGAVEFDAAVVSASLQTFYDKSMVYGDLFPEGSETGDDTEAAPAIWSDRAGFEEAINNWRSATKAALDANPQSLAEARPVVGPVFQTCKGCHDDYRIEKD
ncbi:MAG: cytochrome c [Pseudomonadota bacterium]